MTCPSRSARTSAAPEDALPRQALFLHTVIEVLLGTQLSAPQRSVPNTAILATCRQAGITSDPRTWNRQGPLLTDLAAVLARAGDPVAVDLGARLHPFVEGAFSGPTPTRPEGHLTVFSLRDLPDELRPIGTLLVLNTIWRRMSNPAIRRPRLITVDEAWLLRQDPAGARFLHHGARRTAAVDG